MGGGNGKAKPTGGGKPKLTDAEIIDQAARNKGTIGIGFRRYGAVVNHGHVIFPTFRLDADGVERISYFSLDPSNPTDKGRNAKGKPAGVFLPVIPPATPADSPRVRRPLPGETWIVCEGGKNSAAYATLGHLVVGLNGKSVKRDFLPGFVSAFKGVDLILSPDGDLQSLEAFKKLGGALHGTAKSVSLASLPYGCELRDTGGDDVRDVLKRLGADAPQAISDAIAAAKPIGKDGSDEPEPLPPPVSLREIVTAYPKLRPAVIHGLLRRGEVANVIAHPKAGKSWLVDGLALCVATGADWLDTFPCEQRRVLIIDAELHPENIAHRLPMVAEAMGIGPAAYFDAIDVWPLRGQSADLFRLADQLGEIKPNHYGLIILDAWYRFLPAGLSENDNAAVMSLYNRIDSYTSRLNAAWINVHHASKGDQTNRGVTDVGSGAGSQSRAADTHLVIRPHEQDGVAVIEAVVRTWPPVEPLAIRWSFPVWTLDPEADPRNLRRPRERSSRDDKDRHLDADRRAIVQAMYGVGGPETKTFIRDLARVSNPRFGFAWASLLGDRTITQFVEHIKKANGKKYDAFVLAEQESDV
jgi:hypothetical protein